MQPVSSKIWTRIAVSISYDNNHGHLQIWFLLGVIYFRLCAKSKLSVGNN